MILYQYQVKRPPGTKLYVKNGHTYVYHVMNKTYFQERRYCIEQRKCIGKMVPDSDDMMIPNEKFSDIYPDVPFCTKEGQLPDPPLFSDTLKVGGIVTICEIAKRNGLKAILTQVYGEKTSAVIMNVISYLLIEESSVFQHCPEFLRSHLSLNGKLTGDGAVSRLLSNEITEENTSEFLRQWNALNLTDEPVYIGCDSTNFNTEAEDLLLAEFGCAKDDPTKPQVNLAVAMRQKDDVPLNMDVYPGSIIDMSECIHMVEQMSDYGYRNIGFLFDRGYCCEGNIRFLDENGYDFIMMCKENQGFIQKLIQESRDTLLDQAENFLPGLDVSGITRKRKLYGRERFFHLYYDDVRASNLRRNFLTKISRMESLLEGMVGKKLRQSFNVNSYSPWFHLKTTKEPGTKEATLLSYSKDKDAIRTYQNRLGYFCLIATKEADTATALSIYRGRDNIEKFFRGIKWNMDFNTPSVHSTQTFLAKIHLVFLAGIIRSVFLQASKRLKQDTGNRKLYTIPGMIGQIEMIECTRNAQGIYRRNYALTAKQKRILSAFSVDESTIDNHIRNFQKLLN